jgi:hypothetical protein
VTTNENPGVTGASEVSGGDLDTSILAPIQTHAAKRLKLSDTAEEWLTARAHDLAIGKLGIWDLPPSLVEFYYVAFFAGRDTLTEELTQAQRDADRLYRVAYGPKAAPEPANYRTFAQLEQLRAAMYGGAR